MRADGGGAWIVKVALLTFSAPVPATAACSRVRTLLEAVRRDFAAGRAVRIEALADDAALRPVLADLGTDSFLPRGAGWRGELPRAEPIRAWLRRPLVRDACVARVATEHPGPQDDFIAILGPVWDGRDDAVIGIGRSPPGWRIDRGAFAGVFRFRRIRGIWRQVGRQLAAVS